MGVVLDAEDEEHSVWMAHALRLAQAAETAGEVPVGAVVVRDGILLGEGSNQPIGKNDPTAHAEIQAIRQAADVSGNYRLPDARLYVTLEPCAMCAGAIIHARLKTVIYGTPDEKGGAAGTIMNVLDCPQLNHRCDVIAGVRGAECADLLRRFFQARRR